MIKNILAVLDTTRSSQRVRDISITIANQFRCKITGLCILDTPSITSPYIEPLSGVAYGMDHESEIIQKCHLDIKEILQKFNNRAKKNNIEIKTIEIEGTPREKINEISKEHNLIIISKKTNFYFESIDVINDTVKQITKDSIRPLIIIPPHKKLGNEILIAYDGSFSSTRALHIFLLLGIWKNRNINILSIKENVKDAEKICNQAINLCKLYNINPKIHIETGSSSSDIVKKILDKSKKIKAWMIVMGAFKHTAFHDVFFESCTSILMNESTVPLFIHK